MNDNNFEKLENQQIEKNDEVQNLSEESKENIIENKVKKNSENFHKVILYGKPNVGKSTLFNLISRKQDAIVADYVGLTRDTKYSYVSNKKNSFILADIAGDEKKISANSFINQQLVKRILKEIDESSLILFMLDVNQFDKEDEMLLQKIRKKNITLFLCCNKIDSHKEDSSELAYFYKFGADETFFLSCKTKKGVYEFKKKIFEFVNNLQQKNIVSKNKTIIRKEFDYTVSILGRPNAGKSSFVNHLLKRDRCIVSDAAGTTRDSVTDYFYLKDKVVKIIDTAGLRKKSRKKDLAEIYSNQKVVHSVNKSDLVILMIDAEEQISEQDKKITDIVVHRHKALMILVNKWDKITQKWSEYLDRLLFLFPHIRHCHILPISCKTGKNKQNVISHIHKILSSLKSEITTKTLNQMLEQAVKEQPPSGEHPLKIFYGVQLSMNPFVLKIFVNNKNKVNSNYEKFLVNFIRRYLNLTSIQIILKWQGKK